MSDVVRRAFEEAIAVTQRSLDLAPAIADGGRRMIAALRAGGRILVCGNGGSAADAQHFAAEIVGRFESERPGLPCLALTTNSSILTACANDYGYDAVFARQVAAIGRSGDLLVGISTSGNSPSVVKAMEAAAQGGLERIALTGRGGGALAKLPGVLAVTVPSDRVSRIQEVHITILHVWAALVDEAFGRAPS
jgi:D-sedoheptulose 7-phosphate isomerase